MNHWYDLNGSLGFDNGCATITPPGIEHYRQVYLEVMNTLLIKHGSLVRLLALNVEPRAEHQNPCRILRVTEPTYDRLLCLLGEGVFTGEWAAHAVSEADKQVTLDKGYEAALKEAFQLNLDSLVKTKISIKRAALENLIEKLQRW